MTPDSDPGRSRGILSPADRRYLRQPDEYSRQAAHEREREIQQRIEDALLDFQLLLDRADPSIRRDAFSVNECLTDERPLPVDVVDAAIAFLFLGMTDNSHLELRDGDHHSPAFEYQLQAGLSKGYLKHDVLLDELELRVSTRSVPDESAVRKIAEGGGPIPTAAVASIIETGAIDDSALRGFLREELDAGGGDDEE